MKKRAKKMKDEEEKRREKGRRQETKGSLKTREDNEKHKGTRRPIRGASPARAASSRRRFRDSGAAVRDIGLSKVDGPIQGGWALQVDGPNVDGAV